MSLHIKPLVSFYGRVLQNPWPYLVVAVVDHFFALFWWGHRLYDICLSCCGSAFWFRLPLALLSFWEIFHHYRKTWKSLRNIRLQRLGLVHDAARKETWTFTLQDCVASHVSHDFRTCLWTWFLLLCLFESMDLLFGLLLCVEVRIENKNPQVDA